MYSWRSSPLGTFGCGREWVIVFVCLFTFHINSLYLFSASCKCRQRSLSWTSRISTLKSIGILTRLLLWSSRGLLVLLKSDFSRFLSQLLIRWNQSSIYELFASSNFWLKWGRRVLSAWRKYALKFSSLLTSQFFFSTAKHWYSSGLFFVNRSYGLSWSKVNGAQVASPSSINFRWKRISAAVAVPLHATSEFRILSVVFHGQLIVYYGDLYFHHLGKFNCTLRRETAEDLVGLEIRILLLLIVYGWTVPMLCPTNSSKSLCRKQVRIRSRTGACYPLHGLSRAQVC